MKTNHQPGPWGYSCDRCGMIALAFTTPFPPPSGELLEDMDICQRGPRPSTRRSKLHCQHCERPVPEHHGAVVRSRIVNIDQFIQSRNEARVPGRRVYGGRRPQESRSNHGVQLLDGEIPMAAIEYADMVALPSDQPPPLADGANPEEVARLAETAKTAADRLEAHHPVRDDVDYGAIRAELGKRPTQAELDAPPQRADKKDPKAIERFLGGSDADAALA